MARLSAEDLEIVRQRIEKAALRSFTRFGFNGVTMRDIARDAKVPLGSLYNYFPDKESLFKHLVDQQFQDFLAPQSPLTIYLMNSKFPEGLERMAEAIAASVDHSASYFKLMYVDVVEFDGRHIRQTFSNLEEKFKLAMAKRFGEIGLLGPEQTIEPSFAFVTIYLTFYQYFILSKLFGAEKIYKTGTDRTVIKNLVQLFSNGIAG